MTYFLLGLGVLGGVLLLMKWYSRATIQDIKSFWKWALLIVGAGIVVLALASGRFSWLIFGLPAIVASIIRFRAMANTIKTASRMAGLGGVAGGPENGGRSSGAETQDLRMSLDHESGDMDGEILRGPLAGRRLSQLALDDLMTLLSGLERDGEPASIQLLEAYLDRNHPDWRERAGSRQDGASSAASDGLMTREKALSILGLEDGATEADVKAAYQRIISNLHPDHGGSTYLAAQVNAARDMLLKR